MTSRLFRRVPSMVTKVTRLSGRGHQRRTVFFDPGSNRGGGGGVVLGLVGGTTGFAFGPSENNGMMATVGAIVLGAAGCVVGSIF